MYQSILAVYLLVAVIAALASYLSDRDLYKFMEVPAWANATSSLLFGACWPVVLIMRFVLWVIQK